MVMNIEELANATNKSKKEIQDALKKEGLYKKNQKYELALIEALIRQHGSEMENRISSLSAFLRRHGLKKKDADFAAEGALKFTKEEAETIYKLLVVREKQKEIAREDKLSQYVKIDDADQKVKVLFLRLMEIIQSSIAEYEVNNGVSTGLHEDILKKFESISK